MQDALTAMVVTLKKSVADIVAANPENRDELLEKSFAEYADELAKQADALLTETAEAAAEETVAAVAEAQAEGLYKNLGSVGRIADLVNHLAREVDAIREGDDPDGHDVASDGVAGLLDHMVGVGELALRAAVNEHVAPHEDGEDLGEGVHLLHLPVDGGEHAIVVKTALPEDLAKFATDPGALQVALLEIGAGLMLDGGVPQEDLAKFLDGEDVEPLGKADGPPPPKKKAAQDGAPPAEGDEGGDDADADGVPDGQDPADQGGMGGDMPDEGEDDPLTVLGRLLAAAMIQLSHIQDMLQGGAPDDAGAAEGADQGDAGALQRSVPVDGMTKVEQLVPQAKEPIVVPEQPAHKLAPTAKEPIMAKAAEPDPQVAELQKTIGELQARLNKIERTPEPAKAVVGPTALVSKQADTGGVGGADDELQKIADRVNALPEDQRQAALAQEMIKISLRAPKPVHGGPSRAGSVMA